ncbi:LAMI_0F11056g1_1 [Lachancea mirantina]|uniref:LAMI_0F11056g1_1 n=1 Tax=Lachancea mirantina TaxID=1230905 RepID=A0A1G4K263_9SACH|nr:LAMI_0F11056g1_1 [Lachancea mirantina]
MVSYVSRLTAKTAPYYGKLSLAALLSYTPNLALWGGASMFAVFQFTDGWPKFQDTFYKKIPIFGSHWVKEVDPEDSSTA